MFGGESSGENVNIVESTDTTNIMESAQPSAAVKIGSKQKWHAVAEIECGASPDSIAAKLGVSKEQLKTWYNDIKNSAIKIWGK